MKSPLQDGSTAMGKLDNKVAIVTGAGQGIGRGIAEKLAAEGATVVVTDVNEATAKETAAAIGGGAVGIRTDVTSRESVNAMVDQVRTQFGRIDVLVNNAGWDKASPFVDSDPADFPPIASAVSFAVASLTSVTTTVAPSAASFSAMARPMPCPAPVMIAILPSSLPMGVPSLGLRSELAAQALMMLVGVLPATGRS